jgi:hypothetical protein
LPTSVLDECVQAGALSSLTPMTRPVPMRAFTGSTLLAPSASWCSRRPLGRKYAMASVVRGDGGNGGGRGGEGGRRTEAPLYLCVCVCCSVLQSWGGRGGAEVDHVHNDGCLYVAARVKAKRTAQRPLPQHARALRGRTPPATCGSLERRPAHDSTRWRPRLHTRWCRRPEVHTQPGPTSSEDPCAST